MWWIMGETKEFSHEERLVFIVALFCYACFETSEVGFGLYWPKKSFKVGNNHEIVTLLFFD